MPASESNDVVATPASKIALSPNFRKSISHPVISNINVLKFALVVLGTHPETYETAFGQHVR